MHAVAKHLQAQGRNGDSVLVHMTPGEVGGLQALAQSAGGSLTINPHTGLPEASFLSSILPIVAGIAGTFVGIPPWITAAAVGAITGVAKHDLGAGLMAGLGAYGGAGLGGMLGAGEAGATLAGHAGSGLGLLSGGSASSFLNSASTLASDAAATTAAGVGAIPGAAAASSNPFITTAAQQANMGLTNPVISDATGLAVNRAAPLVGKAALASSAPNAATAAAETAGKGLFGTGITGTQAMMGLGVGLPLLSAMEPKQKTMPEEVDKYPYKGPYLPAPRKARFPTNRDPNDSSEFQNFDTVNPVPNVVPFQPTVTPTGMATGGVGLKDGSFVVDARTVSELGNGSSGAGQDLLARFGGKPIKGPGDGVSDSIRANIGGTQEARVARDEVKFDPKAVQRLGKGDPKKGSDRLYALMAKAHDARQSAKRGQDTGLKGLLGAR